MGIYPSRTYETKGNVLYETTEVPGLKTTRVFLLALEIEARDDCYCCSCGDDEHIYPDIYCRNHGWAGERPCEVHKMPGSATHDTPEGESTEPLESVQQYRRRRNAQHA